MILCASPHGTVVRLSLNFEAPYVPDDAYAAVVPAVPGLLPPSGCSGCGDEELTRQL